ncbi:unnamed protein product [Didymodactylos carnosus]|uniref:TIR domain-containing protein n=1 Tax=Didymodactylos carnosus TaxID=1234261 RepID=A0A8S2J252_9BILA|nr:unnamed protein product [Didymodactylos carnosus]CAF3790065.1 unnamed protein product [Didymodactylos carnosus]
MAIALLLGSSDRPEDLAIISKREVIDDIVYAFINEQSRVGADSWPLKMMTPPLRSLAINEKNRKILAECGIVKPLVEKLGGSQVKEHFKTMENTVGLLVNLAFDREIAEELKSAGAIDKLKALQKSEMCIGEAKKVVEEALWILEDEQKKRAAINSSRSSAKEQKHIMLSYCWAQQPIVLKIRDFLRSKGYKVWIDVEQMAGSTLSAMAEAVENAEVVLIGMSQRYKESENCTVEGNYVFRQKTKFIPLMLEEQYNATGWLGAMVGSRLWYDFSKEEKFTESARQLHDGLLKAMDQPRQPEQHSTGPITVSVDAEAATRKDVGKLHATTVIPAASKWDKIKVVQDLQALTEDVIEVTWEDAKPSSHPISDLNVTTTSEMTRLFDSIT